MKFGGPWNIKGLRPEAREASREAARRAGMSIDEWLNTVVDTAGDADDERAEYGEVDITRAPPREIRRPPRNHEPERNPPQPYYEDPDDRGRNGAERHRAKGPERPYRDEREDDKRPARDDRQNRHGPDQHNAGQHEPDRQGPRRHRHHRDDNRKHAAPPPAEPFGVAAERGRVEIAAVNDRLDRLTQQIERLARSDSPPQRLPPREPQPLRAPPPQHVAAPPQRSFSPASPLTGAPVRPAWSSPPRLPERQNVVENLVPPEVAEAATESAIEQAVAEIAARQRALDGEPVPVPATAVPASTQAYVAKVEATAQPDQPKPQSKAQPKAETEPKLEPKPEPKLEAKPEPKPEPKVEPEPDPDAAKPRRMLGFERRAASRPRPDNAPAVPAPTATPLPAPDLSGLEQHLKRITAQIEALKPESGVETAIAAVRSDLAEIGRSLTEALPRRAVESLEIEVKALADRIDHSRQSGVDTGALAGIESGLNDVREALHGLTPAESLVGVEDAVRALSRKVDVIATNQDPTALHQLEEAIDALRGILNHVASNDTLTKVAEDVRGLAVKVDGVAIAAASGDALSALENRIDTLASALTASTEAGHAVPRELEKLVSGLIDKLEWIQLTHTDHAALGHLEDRIATLVKRLDTSDSRLSQLDKIERGLADLLIHIDHLKGGGGKSGGVATIASPLVDTLKREVDEIKHGERRTRDSLEAMHDTVEHVVDRLAMIENDMRADFNAVSKPLAEPAAKSASTKPALPPAPKLAPTAAVAKTVAPVPEELAKPEILPEASAAVAPMSKSSPAPAKPGPPSPQNPLAPRAPIDPSLPPNHPLEPRSASGRPRSPASPADRIAASETALGLAKPPVIPEGGKSNFIAAARRAAQAAARAAPTSSPGPEPVVHGATSLPRKLAQRFRMLLVAASVVLIVVGGFHVVSRMFDDGGSNAPPAEPAEKAPPSASEAAKPAPPPPAPQPKALPVPQQSAPGRQSTLDGGDRPAWLPVPLSAGTAAITQPLVAAPDITGSVPRTIAPAAPSRPAAPAQAVANAQAQPPVQSPFQMPAQPSAAAADDKLPATIGGPSLRSAAANGDAAAAYEVGVRFAEGHGVPQSYDAAAHWFQRAAKLGLAPAQFRLGGFYEKGIGVKKDLAAARDFYVAAADKGNAKAMHNLAVIYAEGIDGKADYRSAAQWFRKAADYGVADSQYNLAILYARGIGVETNMAESYKWFALAAKAGDKESGKKRDEVAARADAQSLAAAKLAVQTWTAQPQPDDAINVKVPSGGWDRPAAGAQSTKPKPRPTGAITAPGADKNG